YNILRIKKSGKWIYIGSKYNMKNQIDKFLGNFTENDKEKILIVFGFGAGEHIKQLRKKFENNKIIVIDPIENLNKIIDEENWIKNDKKLFIINTKTDSVIGKLSKHLGNYNFDYTKFVSFSPYDKIFVNEKKEFLVLIRNYYTGQIVSRNTQMQYYREWFKIFIHNLKYILSGESINKCKNTYKNIPAVIVSAGPSLEKNIDELKRTEGKFIVITAARTLNILLEKGIKFHFLVVVDPHKDTYNIVKHIIDKVNVPLIFYQYTNDELVKHHNGKKIYYLDDDGISNYLKINTDRLYAGGSVAHTMTDFAAYIGCDPIIYVGQDLAYTNDKSYSKFSGNLDGSRKYDDVKRSDDILIESVGGGTVRTSIVYNLFRENMEKIISNHHNIRFINATEGGARIKGTIEMRLADAIEKYKYDNIEISEYLSNVSKNHNEDIVYYEDEIYKIEKYLSYLENRCLEALNNVERLKKAKSPGKNYIIKKVLKELDKIDESFKDSLIDMLLQPLFWYIMRESLKKNDKYMLEDIEKENSLLYGSILNEIQFAKDFVRNEYKN
ncbi:MAG: motility associated factor glycosyltransferase family protein, partial [Clostridium neonatale]